jgi:hypothetical protein
MLSIVSYIIDPILENPWTFSGLATGVAFGIAAKVYKAGSNWFFDKKYQSFQEKTSHGWRSKAENIWLSVNAIRENKIKSDFGNNPFAPGAPSVLVIPTFIFASCFAYQNSFLIQSALNVLDERGTCKITYLPLDPNVCLVRDVSKNVFDQVIVPLFGATLYPIIHTMSSDVLSNIIRRNIKKLSAFKNIDISGHGEYQLLFTNQLMLTTLAVNKFAIPVFSGLHKIIMIPIIFSDLVWSYETTSKHYHSVAEVLTGLACAGTAHIGISLIEATVKILDIGPRLYVWG